MSTVGCWVQLPGRRRAEPDSVEVSPGSERYELETSHVNRTGIADVPAGSECAVPNLLGIQPAATRHVGESSNSDYVGDVPGKQESDHRAVGDDGGGSVHVQAGDTIVCFEFPIEGAAEDVPVHGGDDILGAVVSG